MTLFSFEVEFDQRVYEQGLMEMNYLGTERTTVPFNVVAESRAIAEAEVINDHNFYRHQNPVIKNVTETKVNVVVILQRA